MAVMTNTTTPASPEALAQLRAVLAQFRANETNTVVLDRVAVALKPINAKVARHEVITEANLKATWKGIETAAGRSKAFAEAEAAHRMVEAPRPTTTTPAAPAPAPSTVQFPEGDRGLGEGWVFFKGHVAAKTAPIPEGNYALVEDPATPERVSFFTVTQMAADHPRWAGWTFVAQHASEERYPVKGARRQAVLEAIAANPAEAMSRFGHETNRCGICNRELTDEESRARGIGPVCARKQGW